MVQMPDNYTKGIAMIDTQGIARHNRMVDKANARIAELERAHADFSVRQTAQGIEIEHRRPTWKKGTISKSYEVIPY
jgi:hypothetical protein